MPGCPGTPSPPGRAEGQGFPSSLATQTPGDLVPVLHGVGVLQRLYRVNVRSRGTSCPSGGGGWGGMGAASQGETPRGLSEGGGGTLLFSSGLMVAGVALELR